MTGLTSCVSSSGGAGASSYVPAVSQLVGGKWGSGPVPVRTAEYARSVPQLRGLVLSAEQSSAVDSRGRTYLIVDSTTSGSSSRRAGPTFLAVYSASGRLITLRGLPPSLNGCYEVFRHVDPIVLACNDSNEVVALSDSGRFLWHRSYPPVPGQITFVASADEHGTEIYEWNDNPTSSWDSVISIDLSSHGKVVSLQRSKMPVSNGGQVGLSWYPGGWVELATQSGGGESCSATVRGFTRSFRPAWTKLIPVDCDGESTNNEIGPVVVGDAVYAGVGSGPIEVEKLSITGQEGWSKSLTIPEGGGLIGGFLMDASPSSLWITGLVGSLGGTSAPELDSILQLKVATGVIAWQGRVVAQFPTLMTLKSKEWAYFEPHYGGLNAAGCRFTEVLEGNYGTRSDHLPIAASVTVGRSACSSIARG